MKSFHQDISHGSIKKIHELCTSEGEEIYNYKKVTKNYLNVL